ncbi:hypothetical protein [Streptomyces sp. NPDC058664]
MKGLADVRFVVVEQQRSMGINAWIITGSVVLLALYRLFTGNRSSHSHA